MSKPRLLILENDDGTLTPLPVPEKKKILTEDLGKIFEMAICLLYDTPYIGNYKYSMEKAMLLRDKIINLKTVFPHNIVHTAKNGARYDYTCTDTDNKEIYLSAKTTKKGDKVCPQVIGQPTKKKFCQFFGLDISITIPEIKLFIEGNIYIMIEKYFEYTFDCPIIYYNEKGNKIKFIKKINNVIWNDYVIEFRHIKESKLWNESTTIYIEGVSIGELQVHNHRDCIKFRWCFEKILDKFNDKFEIINL
jgi:hypothetical protein